MAEIKKSCIEGIGSVPTNWKLSRFRYVFTIKKAKLPDILYDENDGTMEPYMTMEYIRNKENVNPQYTKDGTYCNMDDILLLWDGSNAGEIIYKHPTGYAPSTTAILTLLKSIDKNYAKFYLKFLEEKLRENTNGMGIPHVDGEFLKNLLFLIPNKEEQKFISNFLDDRIEKIDDILKDINREIEILNKYKKSLITKMITKGLDASLTMKDSGIDWIGKIPEKWEIKKLKYLGAARNGLTYSPDDQVDEDEGILVLRSSNIQNGKLSFDDNVYVNMKIPKEIILEKNDLLICSRNGSRNLIGKNTLIDEKTAGQTYGAFMCVYRSKYNKFIHYILNSDIFTYYLSSFLTSTINQLTNANLYSIKIPFTYDIKEQEEIVNYLDKKCEQIDCLVKSKQEQIEKMEQYKKSLIYEYVTGKKRVKGAEELYG